MLLVNKQGINTDMVIETQPSAGSAKPAGGCAGTYMPVDADGKTHPPIQLAGAPAGADNLIASQFKGRAHAPWIAGEGSVSGGRGLTMHFNTNGPSQRGVIAANCDRILWELDPEGLNAAASWVRVRPEGRWNMFVAAGALLGNTAFYLWDTSGASLLWTLLDPDGIAIANNVFASADPLVKNACDYISMAEAGKYYAFSAISEFQSIANEIRIGGEAVAKRLIPLANRTLIEQLVFISQEYKRLPTLGLGTDLPDWGGGAGAFLECQASYQHGVAALQASQVWMLTEAATLLRSTNTSAAGSEEAAGMEAAAGVLLRQLLPQLSRDEQTGGWWHALSPVANGTAAPERVEVRMIHDFLYVGQAIAPNLTAAEHKLMTDFFERELRTPNFARAMSQTDPTANVTGSRRSDHNQWGSWDGWAGGSITALAELGRLDLALEFAQDLSHNLDEGPFGQAHRVFGAGTGREATMARPARKDQSWMAVCSGYIADGIIRGLFGFMPSLETRGTGLTLKQPNEARGFKGTLKHVRYRGGLWTIVADDAGVRATQESGSAVASMKTDDASSTTGPSCASQGIECKVGGGLIRDSKLGLTEAVWVGPETRGIYVGSPSVWKTAAGPVVASHDFFGRSTLGSTVQVLIDRSGKGDNGSIWEPAGNVTGMYWANIFAHPAIPSELLLLGVSSGEPHTKRSIVISRSTDFAATWSKPSVLFP